MNRFFKTAVLAAALGFGAAASALEPFAYPASLLDAPATLSSPRGMELRIGRDAFELFATPLALVGERTGALQLREGRGAFARDYLCLGGTEAGRAMRVWAVSSESGRLTEAQVEYAEDSDADGASVCRPLPARSLPIRLGKIGLGMTVDEVDGFVGKPSYTAADGWSYWFSQRWLRNARGLQELELNWLAAHFTAGRVDRAFISLVKNP